VLECLRSDFFSLKSAGEVAATVFATPTPTRSQIAGISWVLHHLRARGLVFDVDPDPRAWGIERPEAEIRDIDDDCTITAAVAALARRYPGVLPEQALLQYLAEHRRKAN
jgi:hypothetical protein